MKKQPKTDLSKKLKNYALKDDPGSRVIFETGIPQFMGIDKNKSYGAIHLYEDMTEKDVVHFFRIYKKEHRAHLRCGGIKTRKYTTKNVGRDYEWFQQAQAFKLEVNYKKIAKLWAEHNKKEVFGMLLRYLWKDPIRCHSKNLQKVIEDTKLNGEVLDTFLKKLMDDFENEKFFDDLDLYINSQLPCLVRSAVHRYRKPA